MEHTSNARATSRLERRVFSICAQSAEVFEFSREGRKELTPLDEKQRQLLADGFIAEPSADDTTATIAALLRQHADPRFDLALINAVERLLEGTDSLAAFQVMDEVIKRAGGTRRLFAGINPAAREHDMATLRTVWAKARKELHLDATRSNGTDR